MWAWVCGVAKVCRCVGAWYRRQVLGGRAAGAMGWLAVRVERLDRALELWVG